MKKTLFLSLALIAMMVVACGPSQEEVAAEVAAQEQLTADSVLAFDEAGLIQAEAEDAVTDSTATVVAE
jgi:uncharacterized protein YcfL